MNSRRIHSALIGLLLLGAAGCGVGTSAADRSTAPGRAPDAAVAGDAGGSVAGSVAAAERPETAAGGVESATSDPQRAVISRASIAITTKDLARARREAMAITVGVGGHIENEDATSADDGALQYVDLVLRVPAARFAETLDRLGDLGAVNSRTQSTEDVTAQAIDLDAKIKAQAAAAERLRTLMERADSVTDVIAVESQLTSRQAELDALRARRDWLAGQTEQATIEVALARPTPAETTRTGFTRGLYAGWQALRTVGAGTLTALGWLLPFLPVVGAVAVAGWWAKRRRSRRDSAVTRP